MARSEAALMVWGRLAQVMRWHGRCAALAGRQRRAVARRTLATRRLGQVVLCGSSELACGWRSDATLRAGGDLRRRCCAEVAGAVRVWLGTAVRADGRCRGLVRRGLVRARGRTGRPGRRACTRVSERAGCGVARLCSWRRGVHGSASVCTHACAGCGACTRAWAAASCCCAGGRGGRGALGAVAQGRARVEKKDSRAGRARGGESEGRAERAGREKRGRRDLRRIRGARSATRSADHLCSVGCVRGARVNRVMDTGVGSGLREVGRKRV